MQGEAVIHLEELATFLRSEQVFEKVETRLASVPETHSPDLIAERTIAGRPCAFDVFFNEDFPYSLPVFRLRDVAAWPLMAHVNSAGIVCAFDRDSIVANAFDPAEVLKATAERVVQIIERGLSGESRAEVFEELEAFVDEVPFRKKALSILPEMDAPCMVAMAQFQNQWWFGEPKHLRRHLRKLGGISLSDDRTRFDKAIYVPMPAKLVEQLPLFSRGAWWSAVQVREIFWRAIQEHQARWAARLFQRRLAGMPVIFRLPLPNGSSIHVGAAFSGNSEGKHPMLCPRFSGKIFPIQLTRMDKDFLLPRGGAASQFSEKKVLLVGCGSVGSYVANGLLKAGVGHLTMLDPDELKPENSYRHLLGNMTGRAIFKVDRLKTHFEETLPHSECVAVADSFAGNLAKGELDLSAFDLVLSATGNDASNLHMAVHFREKQVGKPLLFVWLDPLELGGHVLLSNMESAGCYQCLFDEKHHKRASFAAGGQWVSRSMAGCNGRFVEFGNMDAEQTAGLAVRLALNVLRGKTHQNQLISWKGDAENFTSQGFQTSARFGQSADELFASRFGFADDRCPVCSPYAGVRSRVPMLRRQAA